MLLSRRYYSGESFGDVATLLGANQMHAQVRLRQFRHRPSASDVATPYAYAETASVDLRTLYETFMFGTRTHFASPIQTGDDLSPQTIKACLKGHLVRSR
jgi:hypothetical protein